MNRLKERLGITQLQLPQLPVIPLGIHTDDFVCTSEQRIMARQAIGVTNDVIVVLYLGRLSFHAKANPLAMYQALERASQISGKKVKLLECGWFANDYTARAFKDAQTKACPSIEVVHLDGRDVRNREIAWSSADLFCSLSDNIQETFGITPVEAMAAGLPVVVTDWDGYKDTVTPDVGFRIPTSMPESGLGGDLAFRHASYTDNYDFYCGHVCSFVGVDIDACATAFTALFNDPELRKGMGQAGRERATALYDWSVIISQYESLWARLEAIRSAADRVPPQLWPTRLDPFTGFSHYATKRIGLKTLIKRTEVKFESSVETLQHLLSLEVVKFAHKILPTEEMLVGLLKLVPAEFVSVSTVLMNYENTDKAMMLRSLSVCIN